MEVFIDGINTIFVEGEGSGSSTFSFRLLGWSLTLQIIIEEVQTHFVSSGNVQLFLY